MSNYEPENGCPGSYGFLFYIKVPMTRCFLSHGPRAFYAGYLGEYLTPTTLRNNDLVMV